MKIFWSKRHGHRKADQAGNGGAESDATGGAGYFATGAPQAGPTGPRAGAGSLIPKMPQAFMPPKSVHFPVPMPVPLTAAEAQRLQDEAIAAMQQSVLRWAQTSANQPPLRRPGTRFVGPITNLPPGGIVYYDGSLDGPLHSPLVRHCGNCGAAYRVETKRDIATGETRESHSHVCPEITAVDLETVRRIGELSAHGLTAEEIGDDLGVRVGWRAWSAANAAQGLWACSVAATWPYDKPIAAVCVDENCLRGSMPCSPKRPFCRVHAMKSRQGLSKEFGLAGTDQVFGLVALWGDVIECEQGWLATRAYPLGLESKAWARAYRCAEIVKPDDSAA